MIQRTPAFKTTDGQTFETLDQAKLHEIQSLALDIPGLPVDFGPVVSRFVIDKADKILDILTTTPTSKTRARRVNGGTKKRTTNPTPMPA